MSSRTGTTGCQPSTPGQPVSSCGNEDVANTENAEKQKDFCRDFIWGQCTKGAQCKYRHELEFEVMKKTLKFCHDFQNSAGCSRELCTYLHATKEEQSLFKSTGQLPQVLAERHANMSAAAAETIPQIALYIKESYAGQPPPPPPPPLPPVSVPSSVAPAPAAVYPRPPIVSVAPIAPRPVPVMPIQQPPPPPPPPTVPSTSVRQRAPVFTAPPPTAPFAMAQPPPPEIPIYDASRPPPPIMPTHAQTKISEPIKRKASTEDSNVRLNKVKKGDDAMADTLCADCVQRELSINAMKKQLEAVYEEEEYESLMYKKKFEEYQNLKEILKSIISTDLFQKFVEENLEAPPSLQEIPQNQSNNTMFNQAMLTTGVSTVPNKLLLQLMEYVVGDAKGVDLVPPQPKNIDESFIQALSSLPRTTSPVKVKQSNSNHHKNKNNAPPEVLQKLLDILQQIDSTDKSSPAEVNIDKGKNASTNNSNISDSQQYSNRQDIPVTVNSSRVPPSTVQGVATSPVFMTPNIATAPPPYQPYQPMTGLYYPPPFPGTHTAGTQMAQDSQAMRAHVPVTMPPAPPPPVSFAPTAPTAPPPVQQPSHYAIGRYPPPYYPGHQ